jgi:Coenzyme PQQ synthesis protein D (PqqD)
MGVRRAALGGEAMPGRAQRRAGSGTDGGRARVTDVLERPDDADHSDLRWLRAESTLWRRTLDGVVVLPFDAPEPLVLRGPAASIWELLEQPMTRSELIDAIVTIYAVERDEVDDDVSAAVATLVDAGALCRL